VNICAWISRFVHNLRHPGQGLRGSLTTEEITKQVSIDLTRMVNIKDVRNKPRLYVSVSLLPRV